MIPLTTDMDALFLDLEAKWKARERAIEMQREAGPLDDDQETDPPEDDNE